MASIISAGTTSATALNMSADTSGVLQLASNNGTVAMTVSTSQTVGIGTTSPIYPLQVGDYSTSATTVLAIAGTTEGRLNFGDGPGGTAANSGRISYFHSSDYMALYTATTERMRIDSSGYVTQPYTPMFSVYKGNGNVSGGSGGGTLVVFDNTFVNNSSSYNTSTGRFTAPVTGTYYFSFSGMINGASGAADIQVRMAKNGSAFTISNPPNPSGNTQGMGFACTGLINLSAGDYVEIYFYASNTTGSSLYAGGGAFNNFSGFLIG